jgi:hypothetical protein
LGIGSRNSLSEIALKGQWLWVETGGRSWASKLVSSVPDTAKNNFRMLVEGAYNLASGKVSSLCKSKKRANDRLLRIPIFRFISVQVSVLRDHLAIRY